MRRNKIIVLGANGMLGQMVLKYFSPKLETIAINERYVLENREEYFQRIRSIKDSYVINCIGRIKQKSNNAAELYSTNCIFPIDLHSEIDDSQILIHPSTDCVYSGSESEYWNHINSKPNASDSYGNSKRLAEIALVNKANVIVIRVSIIGPDKQNLKPSGLLGWFLGNSEGAVLQGYTNHYWNGVTTLQWCQIIEENIVSRCCAERRNFLQPGSLVRYSKFEMLKLFQKTFSTNFSIFPQVHTSTINRALEPNTPCCSLEQQLIELKEFESSNSK